MSGDGEAKRKGRMPKNNTFVQKKLQKEAHRKRMLLRRLKRAKTEVRKSKVRGAVDGSTEAGQGTAKRRKRKREKQNEGSESEAESEDEGVELSLNLGRESKRSRSEEQGANAQPSTQVQRRSVGNKQEKGKGRDTKKPMGRKEWLALQKEKKEAEKAKVAAEKAAAFEQIKKDKKRARQKSKEREMKRSRMLRRTKKGQPVLKHQIEHLLAKAQAQAGGKGKAAGKQRKT